MFGRGIRLRVPRVHLGKTALLEYDEDIFRAAKMLAFSGGKGRKTSGGGEPAGEADPKKTAAAQLAVLLST